MTKPHQKWWTSAERALLEKLRAENHGWDDVAGRCGHTIGSCKTTLSNILTRRAAANGEPPPKSKRRPWTDTDVARLIHLREVEQKQFGEIDREMDRARSSCCAKYDSLRRDGGRTQIEPCRTRAVDTAVLAEREARARLEHPSLTSAFFGDPLPGRSALDQKRAQQR